MATTEQTYATHVHRPRLTAGAGLFAILALACFVVEAMRRPSLLSLGLLCLAASVMVLATISRVYTVRLQDRIILLEMQVRLNRLGLGAEYGRLSKRQLIALRFASDAELPALIQRALTESMTGTQIKQAIRSWQPDHYRT